MIHTLTLNPAIDKILYIDALVKNETNRIQEIAYTVGGKGTHVSMNLACLGETSNAFGICYGETGRKIIDLLGLYPLAVRFVHNPRFESRTNYLLIERGGDSTLITEKGVTLPPEDIAELFGQMRAEICPGDALVISGDVSNCAGTQLLRHLQALGQDCSPHIYLDTSGDNLRHYLALAPYLIKPNLEELSCLCGRPVAQDDRDIHRAILSLTPFAIPIIAVSLGGGGSMVKAGDTCYRVHSLPVDAVNTVGCGDCFLAGLVCGLSKELPIEQTLCLAAAMAGAAAECRMSVGFDPARMRALEENVRIEQLQIDI